jgi:hypothetical protein
MLSIKRMLFEENYAVLHANTTDESLKKTLKLEMLLIDYLQIPAMFLALWAAIELVIYVGKSI